MLRHPSESPSIRPEEGCSSTVIASLQMLYTAYWHSLTNCASAEYSIHSEAAVP